MDWHQTARNTTPACILGTFISKANKAYGFVSRLFFFSGMKNQNERIKYNFKVSMYKETQRGSRNKTSFPRSSVPQHQSVCRWSKASKQERGTFAQIVLLMLLPRSGWSYSKHWCIWLKTHSLLASIHVVSNDPIACNILTLGCSKNHLIQLHCQAASVSPFMPQWKATVKWTVGKCKPAKKKRTKKWCDYK